MLKIGKSAALATIASLACDEVMHLSPKPSAYKYQPSPIEAKRRDIKAASRRFKRHLNYLRSLKNNPTAWAQDQYGRMLSEELTND